MSDVTVSLEKIENKFSINTQGLALGKLFVDEDSIPEDKRRGTATRLLASAILYCYIGSFGQALSARGADADSIDGTATVTTRQDELGRKRISGISLHVFVHIKKEYREIYERVSKILQKGCLISASLEPAFPVTYTVKSIWT